MTLERPRESERLGAQYGVLVESMPDAIVMVGGDGRIVLANTQAHHLFGYDAGKLPGCSIEELLPARFRAGHLDHRAGFFEQPRARPMGADLELLGLRRDGTEFPVEISLSPLTDGDTTLVLSAIRDVTARRQIQLELHEKNVELQAAAEAKNRFLATMSHELRTPLNAIIGFTGTLLMRLPGPLTGDQEKQLRTIQASARHLLSLINDLLDLAKIESGRIEIELQPASGTDVVGEVATALRPLAEQKGLVLRLDLPAADVVVRTDRRALSQILLNLANNAIKFTDRGEVVLSLRDETREGGRVVVFAVADTGCGIRDEDQAQLFKAFTQLDSSSTRRYEGTGLGLHLSQKLAELLGGAIRCESEHGTGSTFTLAIAQGE